MTSNTSLLSIGIPNKVVWTAADVASQIVLAGGSVMTRVLLAFVHIDTDEPSIVLITEGALAKRLSVFHRAGAMGAALHPVAGAFTHKVDTFLVLGTICIVQTVHLNTAPVLVIWVTRIECVLGAPTLSLVADHSASSIEATTFFLTRINALGNTVLVTGCVQRTVNVPTGTLSGIAASREPITNEAIRAAARKTADGVLADARRMARIICALVNVFTAVLHSLEARFTRAVIKGAYLMNLAISI